MQVSGDYRARVKHVTGRLLEMEFRGDSGDIGEVESAHFISDFIRAQAAAVKNPTQRTVVCLDCRGLRVVGRRFGALMTRVLKLSTMTLERSGVIMTPGPIFAPDMDRIASASTSPRRRYFDEPDEAVAWLSEKLTPKEIERLEAFVAAYGGA